MQCMTDSKKNYSFKRDHWCGKVNGTLGFCMSSLIAELYLILDDRTFHFAIQPNDQFMHKDLQASSSLHFVELSFFSVKVVFATPGMLHAGLSLQIFKKWAADEKNMVWLLL